MLRILQVYPQINNAGTERVIFNLYENIDRTKVQFDFLVEIPGELDEKIFKMGGKIFYLKEKSKRKYYKKLLEFFKSHSEYTIVHTHTHARMGVVLKAAKKVGVPCRVAHSHNARNDLPQIARFFKGITSISIEKNANYFFACSENAGKWLFPHRIRECKVIYNGIQLKNYLFNRETRTALRKEMGIEENEFVMIHVGRFVRQKNHEFLLEILEKYNKENAKNWKMLLVGVGPLQDKIKLGAQEKGLQKHIIFLNNRMDVNKLLSVADVFVFPSLHEGLGIVVIEAQASGLPCIVSDAVPKEADLDMELLYTLTLHNEQQEWVKCIFDQKVNLEKRDEKREKILCSKYAIGKIAMQMQEFYLKQNGERCV